VKSTDSKIDDRHDTENMPDLPRQAQLKLQLLRANHEKQIHQLMASWLPNATTSQQFAAEQRKELKKRVITMAVALIVAEASEHLAVMSSPEQFESEVTEIIHSSIRMAQDRWFVFTRGILRQTDDADTLNTLEGIRPSILDELARPIQDLRAHAWSIHEKRLAAELTLDALVLTKHHTSTASAERVGTEGKRTRAVSSFVRIPWESTPSANPPDNGVTRQGRKAAKAKKPARRNVKYKAIDVALRDISKARPRNHEEVFRFLDEHRIAIPNRRPFKAAGGWLKGFQQNPHLASVWLSQRWSRLDFPAFARGPKR
jgi:hypothetical protein